MMEQKVSFDNLPQAVGELSQRIGNMEKLLQQVVERNGCNAEQWMNLEELRTYLPDKPARKTVYKWTMENVIPHYKGSKALRFNRAEIDEWLKEGKHQTAGAILAQISADAYLPIKRKGGANA